MKFPDTVKRGGAAFDAYREFALLSQNTQLSYKKGKKYEPGHPENALEPPADGTGKYTPDMITAGQMSGGAINYRNEPIPFRVNGTGKDADPHECPRREAAAQQQLRDFLEDGTVNQYCDGICEGLRQKTCG